MKHSSRKSAVRKPHSDFPLFIHARGYWAKKVRGKLHYFGKVSEDPHGKGALVRWLEVKDDLLAGRTPRPKSDGFTVTNLCNHFLTAKNQLLTSGELSNRTWLDYKSSTDRLIEVFGGNRLVADLASGDFEKLRGQIAKTRGLVALGNEIQRIRSVFRYAYDAALIEHAVRFGPLFKRPSRKTIRAAKAKQPKKFYSADDITRMLTTAPLQLKAMILLAINCGFGNSDCGTLPIRAVNLRTKWIDYPRPKTGAERRCPLWPETIEAIKAVIVKRKEPTDEAFKDLLFITKQGGSYSKQNIDSPISKEFTKVLKALNLQQTGRGFYSLRHTFRTIADETRDQPACDHIMGHTSEHISNHYRELIGDERLIAVSEYVRTWLFGAKASEDSSLP